MVQNLGPIVQWLDSWGSYFFEMHPNFDEFQSVHLNWVEAALSDNRMQREECWTRSVASGSRSYVKAVKNKMGGFAIGRKIRQNVEDYELREDQPAYNTVFDVEKNDIEGENLWYWNDKTYY